MSDMMIFYWIIPGIFSLIGMWLSNRLKSRFEKHSKVPVQYSGAEIAAKMLEDYNVHDVKIVQGQGFLSDHYNPMSKTVSLSPAVFQGRHASAAAVAAHECGHAIQHAESYAWLQMRSAMVPFVKFSSMAQQWVLMGAFYLFSTMPQLMLIAIAVFAITTAFSFITLPVEFDASNRALAWLDKTGTLRGVQYDSAKDALKWAAMTYVSAALSALVMLLFLVMKYAGNRN